MMGIFDGLFPTYTIRLQISRSDQTILDTEITARAVHADEVTKAKKSIQRLLNDYATPITIATKAPAPPPPKMTTPALPEPEIQLPAAEQQQGEPAEIKQEPPPPSPPPERKLMGIKGLVDLQCPECGKIFITALRDRQKEVDCKCGHRFDLTAPLARFNYTCPYCEQTRWGHTNREDPDITVRCKCGGDVDLRWNPKAREYQN